MIINFLKNIFACKHKHTKEGFKSETRFDRPIMIDYKECLDCGRVLRCKVSFVEVPVKPTVSMPPQRITLATDNKEVVTGTVNVAPTVHLSLDLTENPGQNRKEAEVITPIKEKVVKPTPIIGPVPPKELVLQGLKPTETKPPAPLVDAEKAEELLNTESDDSPLSNSPDALPAPDGTVVEDEDDPEEESGAKQIDPHGAMKEGMCFLKESKSSISRRRKELARKRARILEQLKKTGKATVQVQKKPSIPSLTDPDGGDNRQSECT